MTPDIAGKTIKFITYKYTWDNREHVEEMTLWFTDGTKTTINGATNADAWDGSTEWLSFTSYDKNGKYIPEAK